MTDSLDEGRLSEELQVSSWPPTVAQTLVRKSDGRQGLTIRAQPSGRLRVELQRKGYDPVVVRSMHLNMRAPIHLRLNMVWRGTKAALAANGQVIGTSNDRHTKRFETPAKVHRAEAPTDDADNERARALRRQRTELMLKRFGADDARTQSWFATLAMASQVVADFAELVREGRRHHLHGLMTELVPLIVGGEGNEPLLQLCAGAVDAPLLIHTSMASSQCEGEPPIALTSALDVTPAHGDQHERAVDLDAWLRQTIPWLGGQPMSVESALPTIVEALALPRPERPLPEHLEFIRNILSESSNRSIDALCEFALTVCHLARAVCAENTRQSSMANAAQ